MQTNSEFQCRTCENKDCEYYDIRENMSAGKDRQTGWRASPAVITFAVGCLSHSAIATREWAGKGYLDKEAVLKAFKEEPLEFYNRLLHGEFDVPEMCCHRQNERDRLLKSISKKDAEITRLKAKNSDLDSRLWNNAANTQEEIKRLKDQNTGYSDAIKVLRESKDAEISRLKEQNRNLLTVPQCVGDEINCSRYEISRLTILKKQLEDRIAQQDQELKDLGSELQDLRHQPGGSRCLCNICREEKGTGDGVYCKPVRVDIEKARLKLEQPVPSDIGMAKDIGDLTLRMDKLEQQLRDYPLKTLYERQNQNRVEFLGANARRIQEIVDLTSALKSIKEEVAGIPHPPKDRENYYEIDLGPGFQKIYISKNSVYPVLDQDSGGKKE